MESMTSTLEQKDYTSYFSEKDSNNKEIIVVDTNTFSGDEIDGLRYTLSLLSASDSNTVKSIRNFENIFNLDEMREMNQEEIDVFTAIREKGHKTITFKKL